MSPSQGDIWWAEAQDKRRPVLIVTRTEAIPVLSWIVVAPITRTVRNIPTEIHLDVEDGLPTVCAASFDNIQPIRKGFLTDMISSDPHRHRQICRALAALADC